MRIIYCILFFAFVSAQAQNHSSFDVPENVSITHPVRKKKALAKDRATENAFMSQSSTLYFASQKKAHLDRFVKNRKNEAYFYKAFLSHYYYYYEFEKGKITAAERIVLDTIYQLYKGDTGTFEYHFISYKNFEATNSHKAEIHLNKAFDLNMTDMLTISGMIKMYEKNNKTDQRNTAVNLYMNHYADDELSTYYHDLVRHLPEKAVFITTHEREAFYVWYLNTNVFRKNVRVLYLPLSANQGYLSSFMDVNDITLQETDITDHNHVKDYQSALSTLFEHTSSPGGYYVSLNLDKETLNAFSNDLYLYGNYYLYAPKAPDPEKIFSSIYRFISTSPVLSDQITNIQVSKNIYYLNDYGENALILYRNYINSYLYLYKYYRKKEQQTEAETYKNYAFKLAEKLGIKKEISAYFE